MLEDWRPATMPVADADPGAAVAATRQHLDDTVTMFETAGAPRRAPDPG